jgi:hypothetical protein
MKNQVSNSTLESNCENTCDPLAVHLYAFLAAPFKVSDILKKHIGITLNGIGEEPTWLLKHLGMCTIHVWWCKALKGTWALAWLLFVVCYLILFKSVRLKMNCVHICA